MYTDMDQWIKIRRKVLVEGVSKRQIIRETGMHWATLQKILSHSSPPGYRRTKPPKKSKLDPFINRIRQIFNPVHYLRLIQRKPGSLDYARPLEELRLPKCFDDLRSVQEARLDDGIHQFIAVLRLLEDYSIDEVAVAIGKSLRRRVYCSDAITQFLPNTKPWAQTTFKLDGREHLRMVKVADNDVACYQQLLGGGAA